MFSFQRRRDCYVFFTHVVVCYVFWTCVLYGHSLHVTRCVWWKSVRTVIYIWKRYPCNWRSLESSEWGRRSKKTTASFYLPCSKHTYCASSIAKSWKKLIIKIIVPFYSKANIVVSKLNLSEIQAGGEDLWWENKPQLKPMASTSNQNINGNPTTFIFYFLWRKMRTIFLSHELWEYMEDG